MKTFKDFINEDRISKLQELIKVAETPEEIERLTKELEEISKEENKQYK